MKKAIFMVLVVLFIGFLTSCENVINMSLKTGIKISVGWSNISTSKSLEIVSQDVENIKITISGNNISESYEWTRGDCSEWNLNLEPGNYLIDVFQNGKLTDEKYPLVIEYATINVITIIPGGSIVEIGNTDSTISAITAKVFGNSMIEFLFPENVTIENKESILLDAVTSATRVWFPDSNENSGKRMRITFPERMAIGAHTVNFGTGAISENGRPIVGAGYVITVMAEASIPKLSSVRQSTEYSVIYEFSEEINDKMGTFYYRVSRDEHNPSSSRYISDNEIEVFWDDPLPSGSVAFFAKNVEDYMGNRISPNPSCLTCVIK